ncbi:MAG: DegT/DnrJ/EryC1/StrS family aminotransferase [Verrucomicrobiales bacterium]|nr:DegT/DnrJ/EryC1/StrS family aminotransferase [Verrucomicrobiales bacterium]
MNVPFLDLKAQLAPLRSEINAAISEVLDTCAFAGGPFVAKFEEEFAAFCQCPQAIGVGNGTDALWFALLALGVGPGDEVITVPSTFMATAEAISFTGAKPVFVDIDETTYTLDPRHLERAVTPRTKAIIPVHLFGQTADMDPILEFAAARGLYVVEDACQAHGAEYKGRRAGSLGHAGCFSFYPGKNLGAVGEAGAVVTRDASLADRIRVLRDHGQIRKYQHTHVGWNGRMDGIQGAALRVKLRHLARWNTQRRAHARRYNELLADVPGLKLPTEAGYARHVYHIYPVRVARRDETLAALGKLGVNCGIHYPIPVHRQDAYASLKLGPGSFPVAERCSDEFLSLPMFPELTPEQVEFVAKSVREVLASQSVSSSASAAKA